MFISSVEGRKIGKKLCLQMHSLLNLMTFLVSRLLQDPSSADLEEGLKHNLISKSTQHFSLLSILYPAISTS